MKVSSADENLKFFASVNLTDRAAGLSSRLDGMGKVFNKLRLQIRGLPQSAALFLP